MQGCQPGEVPFLFGSKTVLNDAKHFGILNLLKTGRFDTLKGG